MVTMGSAHLGALPLGAVGRRDFVQVCFFFPFIYFILFFKKTSPPALPSVVI